MTFLGRALAAAGISLMLTLLLLLLYQDDGLPASNFDSPRVATSIGNVDLDRGGK